MTLLTREEIASAFRQYAAVVVQTSWDDHRSEIAVDESFKAADALLARLRPAWEALKQTASAERTRYALADAGWEEMNRQNNILRASLARKDEALRACVEALTPIVTHCTCSAVVQGTTTHDVDCFQRWPMIQDARAALARPGVKETP